MRISRGTVGDEGESAHAHTDRRRIAKRVDYGIVSISLGGWREREGCASDSLRIVCLLSIRRDRYELLSSRDGLRYCSIVNWSVLSLHSIGLRLRNNRPNLSPQVGGRVPKKPPSM